MLASSATDTPLWYGCEKPQHGAVRLSIPSPAQMLERYENCGNLRSDLLKENLHVPHFFVGNFFFTLACGSSQAEIAYTVPDGTAIHEKPNEKAKIVYRKRSHDSIYRAKISKKVGDRVFKTATDGAPVCKAGWCEVCMMRGQCGYVPARALQTFKYDPSNDGCDVWIDDDC